MTAKKKDRRQTKFTEARMGQALTEAYGVIETAARRLSCSRKTVYEYLKRYPALDEVLSEARESALDFAESKLMAAIEDGNLTAIIFFLKTRGKSRGYSERTEDQPERDFKFTLNIGDKGNRDM